MTDYLQRLGISIPATASSALVLAQKTFAQLTQTLLRFANSNEAPYAGTAAVLLVAATLLGVRSRRHDVITPALTESDLAYMNRAQKLLKRCRRPIHSGFLVSSVVVYDDLLGVERFEVGVNCETCVLSSAICAERSALVQIRLRDHGIQSLKTVYITATSNDLITPGLLCREFMMEFIGKKDTPRVVLFSQLFKGDLSSSPTGSWRVHHLRDLYPFPPLYHRVPREKLIKRGEELSMRNAPFDSSSASIIVRTNSEISLPPSRYQQLYDSVLRIAQHDRKDSDSLYPIHLAAGVLFADASTERTRQDKALEYGCTLDCVSKLTHAMEAGASRGCNPVFVITIDQFGVCWAPSASARAWLTEALSLVKVTIPVHAKDGTLHFVTQDELSPASPAISLASAAAEQFSPSSPSSSLSSSSSSSYSSSTSSVTVLHPERIQDGFGTPPRI